MEKFVKYTTNNIHAKCVLRIEYDYWIYDEDRKERNDYKKNDLKKNKDKINQN